jgi:hypothetical protein
MELELGSQVDAGFYSLAPSRVMVKGWPQKRSNELNIRLVVRVKGWPQKRRNEYCIGSIQKTLPQKDFPCVKTQILILLVCTFYF